MNSETSTPVATTVATPTSNTPPAPLAQTAAAPAAQPAPKPVNPLAAKYRKGGKFNRAATPPTN